ncbi:MAG: hypothetical protein AVDCRST_MAG45-1606 [uncultured Solirubrobacterales bacterium]|uniref:Uncharacterized protein n=1 Tax=uncultured Solirubrobacterales bacterium TaxID=768556 RepID=A0A6J4SV27_9ACTN|nr:MAG: hypothetical protein AVDCRST_MAG45-1606 [uncultured Solirubrobacterales bacterium]
MTRFRTRRSLDINPPANFQPIEQLGRRLLGGALGGGAGRPSQ